MRDAEAVVFSYRKELEGRETRARQQANLYRAARNDRAALARALTESRDEAADLKGKLRVLQHQFDQLKEEMVAKEAALAKEGHQQARLVKDKEELQAELERAREDTRYEVLHYCKSGIIGNILISQEDGRKEQGGGEGAGAGVG